MAAVEGHAIARRRVGRAAHDLREPRDLRIDPEAPAPGPEGELHPSAFPVPPGRVVAEGAAGEPLPRQVPAHETVHGQPVGAHDEAGPLPEQRARAVDGEERGEPAEDPGGGPRGRRARQGPEGEEQAEPGVEIIQEDRAERVAVAALACVARVARIAGRGSHAGTLGRALPQRCAHRDRPSRSRLTMTPAASRSQLSAVIPSARNLCFSTFSVGVLGSASTIRT